MIRSSLVVLCLLCAAIFLACSKSETGNSNVTANNSNKVASKPATATTTTSGEKIGVPECDDFITKYEACVSGKVPESARATYQNAVKQWRESWKKLAENPQTKGTLAAACKQAREQQEAALKSYGCSW